MNFDEIHNKYFQRLVYFAEKIVHDREQAKDIVSEALVKVWQRFNKFDNESALKSFMYVVVKNSCFNYTKKYGRDVKNKEGFYYVSEETEECVLHYMMLAEVLAEITNGIEKLPECERKVFKLMFFMGMNAEQIAGKLGLSVQTVRNQKTKAINKLKYKFLR